MHVPGIMHYSLKFEWLHNSRSHYKKTTYFSKNSLQVYVVDDRHLFIQNFRYEKTGPNVYFWVGNTMQPSPRGKIVPYPPQPDDMNEKNNLLRSGGQYSYNMRQQGKQGNNELVST